jgi:hypothetical protein
MNPRSNEQYEELDISKNSGKPYKNTNFDNEDIKANHKSFMSSLNIPINDENCELSTTNTNFIVLGLTRLRLEPTIYRTRGEHANHYATDPVLLIDVTT